jgi:tryptophan-rich sensory protein
MRIPVESSTSYRGRNAKPNWVVLLLFVGTALGVGSLGILFLPGPWYAGLSKPAWTPPDSWFGPIWAVLYLSMGIAAWLVWSERYHRARNASLLAYGIQLLINALWVPVFFGAKNIGAALFVIVALWLSVAWTLREFSRVKLSAAWLLVPYIAWATLAVALNLSIWKHNP